MDLRAPSRRSDQLAPSPRDGTRRLRAGALAGLAVLAVGPAAARATGLPRQDSLAAVIDQTFAAVLLARQIAPALGLAGEPVNEAVEACRPLSGAISSCREAPLGPCAAALPPLFDALRALQAHPVAPAAGGAAGQAAAMVADAAMRLGTAADTIAAGACDPIAPAGGWPTRMALAADASSLVAEPVLPLRAGRRYALLVRGLPAADATASASLEAPARPADGRPPEAERAVARIISAAGTALPAKGPSGAPSVTPLEGVRVTLATPLTGEALAAFRVSFFPEGRPPPPGWHALLTVSVIDLRAELGDLRRRVAALPCQDVTESSFPSLTIESAGGAGTTSPTAGTRPAVAARSRRVLLRVPAEVTAETPLVIALHGLGDSADSFVASLGPPAVSRGLALLALELPGHEAGAASGTTPATALLDPARPETTAALVRQAVVDVMAAVHAARGCGLARAGGARFRPAEVRYLGYSLGAITGAIARTVEPDLGATVLVAPGGDLFPWLVSQLGARLGFGATCVGGPSSGGRCDRASACPEPGLCLPDAGFFALGDDLRVAHRRLLAAGDPAAYASERTGQAASHAPLLLVTGGRDTVLPPLLATRLADALGTRPVAATRRVGPDTTVVSWPTLGHGLLATPAVRDQVFAFLASRGRQVLPVRGAVGHGPGDEEDANGAPGQETAPD